jgi:hypothetical protein
MTAITLIETRTLGTAAASIEFTSIPQTSTDLLLLISSRASTGSVNTFGFMTVNGSTASLSRRNLQGTGSITESGSGSDNVFFFGQGDGTTANTFDNIQIYIPNYTGSTNKSFNIDGVTENNATGAIQFLFAGLRSNTAAITSLAIGNGTNFVAGTTVSLYGILKGSSGGVVVS